MNTARIIKKSSWLLALAGMLAVYPVYGDTETSGAVTIDNKPSKTGETKTETKTRIVVKGIESPEGADMSSQKDRAWLGVAFEEAPEVLVSQLGLDPGVGLVVTYVTTDSPAAKAGLQKNDVLAEFGDQSLVHPAQLRKLVALRKEGDTVKLGFYRGGKKQTVSVTLAKAPVGLKRLYDDRSWTSELGDLQQQIREMPVGNTVREQMKALKEALGNAHLDAKVQQDIRHNMEQARQAYQQAVKNAGNANSAFEPVKKALEELGKAIAQLGNSTVATMNSKVNNHLVQSVDSLVKTDDSGTIVIIRTPKLHLTAHDKTGKLLYDGEIESAEQREKVPGDLWEKVEPLLKKMAPDVEKPQSKSSKKEEL